MQGGGGVGAEQRALTGSRRQDQALLSPGPWFSLLVEKQEWAAPGPPSGGPGTDLLGLCRHLALAEKPALPSAVPTLLSPPYPPCPEAPACPQPKPIPDP